MLTRHPLNGRDASYSSDGNKIVYVSDYLPSDWGVKVWVMNADGTNHMPLDSSSRSSTFPRIRPSTNELWFSFGIDLTYDAGTYMINLDSVALPANQSSFIFKSKDHFLRESQWSLDGNRFISVYATTSVTPDLVISEAHSVSYTFLTSGFNVVLFSPAWAPGGGKLVFYAIPKGEDASAIFTCDIPSYELRRITILNN
jgi:Tol biopolymer transport system component